MKKFLILIMVAAVAFSGCKDDDGDDNNNNGPAAKKISILEVRTIDWVDDQGKPWDDDGTGPDLQIKFGPPATPAKYSTPVRNDIAPQSGAIKLDVEPNVTVSKETWTFTLWDIDNFGDDRVMYTWTHDFSNTTTNTVDKHQGSWYLRIHLKD